VTEVGRGGGAEPYERFVVGQAKTAVIVGDRHSTRRMSTGELRSVVRFATIEERRRGLRRMIYCGEPQWRSISTHVLRRACLLLGEDYSGPTYALGRIGGTYHRKCHADNRIRRYQPSQRGLAAISGGCFGILSGPRPLRRREPSPMIAGDHAKT
jgi:hypothetical protein